MFIVDSYPLAVLFCFITMMCWGSWGNTQKLASREWRYELFYWDYVIGMFLFSLLISFTMGSFGSGGRHFIDDLGVGLSLVLGTVINYIGAPKGDPVILFAGVALIVVAVICNGIASSKMQREGADPHSSRKGILLAIIAGVLMSFFYRFVAAAMDLDSFAAPAAGKLTPYSAIFIFSVGVLVSNLLFNSLAMHYPFAGAMVTYGEYFKGRPKTHLVGMLGGAVWCLGTAFSYIASGKAGAAISYALGQGAPMVAAIWGVFIWMEFKGASKGVYALLAVMFLLFVSGLGLIIASGY